MRAALKVAGKAEKTIGWPRLVSRQSPVDFAAWLRGPLRTWAEDVCLGSFPVADEVLRPDFVERAWREHLAGQDRTTLLGVIIGLRAFSLALDRARKGVAVSNSTPTRVQAT
jgi:asparagine synthase (glutamine-hydrolysing)